ncbi:MAG: cohesin domain-containing protein, partial [Thermoproteota archaeon]
MRNKILPLFMASALLASMLVVLPPVMAYQTKLKVEPAELHFWSDVDPVGKTFTISIIAENIIDQEGGMYGWEFWLTWTPGVIDCIEEVLNLAFWPQNSGPLVPNPIDNAAGTYHQSVAARAPSNPVTGTYWLVNLTFKIVAPAPYMGVVSTPLTLAPPAGMTYCLVDKTATEIPHDYIHGAYYYHWAPPSVYPKLELEYTGEPEVNEKTFYGNIYREPITFSIDIRIKNVDAGWRLAGIQFVLFYNTTILDVLEVAQGDFLEPFTTTTWFYGEAFENAGFVRVAYCILDIPSMIPPYGEGLVARITFNATYQEPFPTAVSSDLDIEIDTEAGMGSYFINFMSEELPYSSEKDGKYTLAGYVLGRVIDIYTQYPKPYGGQGPGAPSDMFWPQKEVELFANVTYNDWPIQRKDVTFEIRNPKGELVTILTARTDENGVAHTTFRIPWPCENPESLFGVWTVIGTVDIACQVVNDTLRFHFDYLVHWIKVTTDKKDYAHCENINVIIEFGSYAMQTYNITLAVAIHDELNVPFGRAIVPVEVGGATWCTLKNYTA